MSFDIDKARRLCDEATEGPWWVATGCSWRRVLQRDTDRGVIVPTTAKSDGHPDLSASSKDLSFCAEARTLLPEALDEIERLQAALSEALAVGGPRKHVCFDPDCEFECERPECFNEHGEACAVCPFAQKRWDLLRERQ